MDKERMAELEKIEAHGAENGWVAPMTAEDREFFAYFRSVFKRYNISPSKGNTVRGTMRQTGGPDYLPAALRQTMKNRFLSPVTRVFRKRFLTTCLTTDRRGVCGNSGSKSCEEHP